MRRCCFVLAARTDALDIVLIGRSPNARDFFGTGSTIVAFAINGSVGPRFARELLPFNGIEHGFLDLSNLAHAEQFNRVLFDRIIQEPALRETVCLFHGDKERLGCLQGKQSQHPSISMHEYSPELLQRSIEFKPARVNVTYDSSVSG